MATWQHLRSSTANKRPTTSLADGRIAINTNTASPGLFFKDSAGTGIVKVGPVHVGTTAPNSVPAAGGSSGNYLGEQWLDTSVSPAQMKVWNGSTWVGIVADELPVSKLQDGAARQLIQTDAAGTGVEWTSDVDVPGTLDVTSTATFDSIAQHPLGTAGAPTITFTGDNNTGIYSPGADQVAISTGGSGRLFVDANGNIAIGTSATSNFGATARSFDINSAGGIANLYVKTGTVNGGLQADAGNGYMQVWTASNHPIAFNIAFSEKMRLDTSGRLGVGTSSPVARLETISTATVNGVANCTFRSSDNASSSFYIGHGAGGIANLVSDSPIGFGYNNGGTYVERMRLDTSGRLGVGITSVNATRQVEILQPSGYTSGLRIRSDGSGAYNEYFSGVSNWTIGSPHNTNALVFGDGTERLRIDSSGRVGIGTSAPAANSLLTLGGSYPSSSSTTYVHAANGTIPSSSTVEAAAFLSNYSTQDAAVTYSSLAHYIAAQGTITGGSRLGVTTQIGFQANASLTGATNNYGFFSNIAAGSGRWNFYAAGTANNYFAGSVGIGTTPDSRLHIQHATTSASGYASAGNAAIKADFGTGTNGVINLVGGADLGIYRSNSSGAYDVGIGFGDNSNRILRFDTAGTERARIDSSGRLLVGTSSTSATSTAVFASRSDGAAAPLLALHTTESTVTNGANFATLSFGNTATTGTNAAAFIQGQRDGGTWTNNSSMPGRLVFSTTADGASSPTGRMAIRNNGQILSYNDNVAGSISLNLRSGVGASSGSFFLIGSHSATGVLSGSVTDSIYIFTNGNVQNTNNSYGAISDAKLKENIVDAASQWSDIKALQVRKYNFKEGQTHTQIGLIAQEVELVSPGLVSESPDRDEDGNDLGTVTKSVNYSVLYMKAVKALQEAMERIETLEAKVTALESA